MEGLIPLVYRAIRRKKTRRCYECLSSGAAAAPFDNAEFDASGRMFMTPPPPENHGYYISSGAAALEMTEFKTNGHRFMTPPPPEKLGGFGEGKNRLQRHKSMQEYIEPPRLRKDFGMRSHRVFACISGG